MHTNTHTHTQLSFYTQSTHLDEADDAREGVRVCVRERERERETERDRERQRGRLRGRERERDESDGAIVCVWRWHISLRTGEAVFNESVQWRGVKSHRE